MKKTLIIALMTTTACGSMDEKVIPPDQEAVDIEFVVLDFTAPDKEVYVCNSGGIPLPFPEVKCEFISEPVPDAKRYEAEKKIWQAVSTWPNPYGNTIIQRAAKGADGLTYSAIVVSRVLTETIEAQHFMHVNENYGNSLSGATAVTGSLIVTYDLEPGEQYGTWRPLNQTVRGELTLQSLAGDFHAYQSSTVHCEFDITTLKSEEGWIQTGDMNCQGVAQ